MHRLRSPTYRGHDAHAGAAFITLGFVLLVSVMQAVAVTPSVDQPERGGAQQVQNQALWDDQEAVRRATDGDYDGAVQAQQEAERDRAIADRLRHDENRVR